MTWPQTYDPMGHLLLSCLLAALPVAVLLGLLGILRVRAHFAALAGLGTTLAVALGVYRMPPRLAGAALANGAAYGLFPIGWIVLCAIFVYDITVKTGKFEIVKQTIVGLTEDKRIQVLLIAFCFGAFIEGAAGSGTPVAICSAMLIGLGFRPLPAAFLALIGNTAPVAFGALGSPIIALAGVTGLPMDKLGIMVGRQLPIFAILIPFWLVWAYAGRKGVRDVWPACLVSGLSFALVQFMVSNFFGPTLVDICAAIVSIIALVLFLRLWQPRREQQLSVDVSTERPSSSRFGSVGVAAKPEMVGTKSQPTLGEAIIAWAPWIILSALVFLWGLPEFKKLLDGVSVFRVQVPYLHRAVLRMPPVVAAPKAEDAVFVFNWLSASGTALMLSGLVSGLILGLKPMALLRIFFGSLKRVRWSLLTIAAMLALGYTTRYAGLDATMGLVFAKTGPLFPFFSPLLGWLGVALTGSDTSSNVLFGNLQQITAQQLGFSPLLAAAANSSGGVMGKMIDAQSIVVAGVATGQQGNEGEILRRIFFHSLVLAALVGIEVLLQAYVFPGVIP